MRSIRGYLRAWLVLGVAMVGIVGGSLLYGYVRQGLVDEFDRTIKAKARGIGAFVERSGDFLEFSLAPGALPEFEGGSEPEYFQVFLADGRTIVKSKSLGVSDLPFRFRRDGQAEVFDLGLPDGRPGRGSGVVCAVRAGAADDPEDREDETNTMAGPGHPEVAIVVVARSSRPLLASLDRLLIGITGVAIGMGVAVFALVTVVIGRGLAPLGRLADRATRIDSRSLAERLPESGSPKEIAVLAARLNELLARLEGSFQRERRMTANLAHELRTPIAELGVASDLARRWSDDPELQSSLAQTAHEVAGRMGRIVANLLHLARVEAGSESLLVEKTVVADLVRQAFADLAPLVDGRELECVERPQGLEVAVDRALLGVVINNLAENALRHSPRGERIRSEIRADGARWEWSLANRTPDLQRRDLEHLTEAFWRKDDVRSRRNGTGLGLAIARAAVDVMGGSLEFTLEDGLFRATVRLSPDRAGSPLPDAAHLQVTPPTATRAR